MRWISSLAVALMLGCQPTYLIVHPDAAAPDAPGSDAGLDAPPPVEPVGGSECDQQDDCEACGRCSTAPHELCNNAALTCENDPSCLALNECINRCGSEGGCMQACADLHPAGIPLLVGYIQCAICDACPADCRASTAVWCEEPPF